MGMNVVEMDDRGRVLIPADLRRKLKSRRFLLIYDSKSIRLIPLRDPASLRGSIEIPWTLEELEEAGEELASKRSQW
jgi:bifunctional DNA-binding transcriptional regulator/antitoxin component of YhaV-PrlF toxin-antitoxin module